MDTAMEDHIARQHWKLAAKKAHIWTKRHGAHWYEDFLSAAFLGLANGIKTFDPASKMSLSKYLAYKIENELCDELRRKIGRRATSYRRRLIIMLETDAPPDGKGWDLAKIVLDAERSTDPEGDFIDRARALGATQDDVGLLLDYFYHDKTLKEIAAALGVGESRICQKLKTVIDLLRGSNHVG